MTPPKHILGTFDEALSSLRNNVLMMAGLAERTLDRPLAPVPIWTARERPRQRGEVRFDERSPEQRCHQQRDEENPQEREEVRPVHGLFFMIAYATRYFDSRRRMDSGVSA